MKCVILAAGYATRLYPLTEHFPKPLLPVGGKPILDWLIEDVGDAAEEFIVISNHPFAGQFEAWAAGRPETIRVLDDGTESNETRLGAVRDIQFAVDALGLADDLLVMAGDNLLDFSLRGFLEYQRRKQRSCIMRYCETDETKLRRSGVAQIDNEERVLCLEEKPVEPKSRWCVPAFYFYRAADVPLIRRGIDAGCGVDAPGSLIAWLCTQTAVYAYEMPGSRYDIGNLESYRAAQESYRGITR